ncbi:MAG: bifunctional shikimate kinase/3-dehydroquinate synthase [Solirubrobacterales bacterium]
MALVLIGFMGAGKSTLARRLAEQRGRTPLDSDTLLAERFGHSVAREFELHGEQSFRAAEEELVCRVLSAAGTRDVIALGGGSVLSERVRAARDEHVTVLVDVDPALAWERVRGDDGAERPLARDRAAFDALYAERRGLYEQAADAWLLWAESASGDYPVFVGRGLLNDERLASVWPLDRAASRPFCITDETVGALYLERLGALAASIAIPPGESHKTLATAELVWRELAHAEMTRADHLVALGGGVVGDLAGFCAATYQRGVPVVQVPTTLVAQVDSAYGGKTGVDLPEAKNYVGAYHQPAAVLVDPDALGTLPEAELNAGWVEVLKTALIAGGELWERVAAEELLDERTILACARLKLAVVAEDERDAGRRQVLNLGHTVGHAIETATGYARYRHGEAVGLGLLAALRLSGREELRAQVRELLLARRLPVTLQGCDVEQVVRAVAHDKKRLAGPTPFVLLDAPGEVRVGCAVPEKELRAAVAELG